MDKHLSLGDRIFGLVNAALLMIVALITAWPLVWVFSSSVSDPHAQLRGEVTLLPIGFNLTAYRIVFNHPEIWTAYRNTIFYTALGVLISVSLSALYAYPLSRKHFFASKFFTSVLLITMLFSGGMIPTFLLVRDLGLLNTIWAIIIPGSVSVFNVMVMRTFFQQTIPDELEESAFLDGSNDVQFFWSIVLPLSKAIMSVMVLFYGVVHWNAWFNAFLYISSRSLFPLTLILREIILQGVQMAHGDGDIMSQGVRFATMIVATVPIMCLYPFIQKHFTKGVMLGSVKG